MTRVVLVHGAWHDGSCWDPVVAELAARGLDAVAVDLPCEEPGLGALDYADVVERVLPADGDEQPVLLVGHSLAGLTVPVVAQRTGPGRVGGLVLVDTLLPQPGSSCDAQLRAEPGLMAEGFGVGQQRHEDRTTSWPLEAAVTSLYRGVADELRAAAPDGAPDDGAAAAAVERAAARLRRQAWTVSREITPLTEWPAVPITVVVSREDRVVAPEHLRARTKEIPGAELVEIAGGHFPMLTRPGELAEILAAAASRR